MNTLKVGYNICFTFLKIPESMEKRAIVSQIPSHFNPEKAVTKSFPKWKEKRKVNLNSKTVCSFMAKYYSIV